MINRSTCLRFDFQLAWHAKEGHVKLSVRKAGRATILDFEGALKLGEAEDAVRQQMQQLVDGGSNKLACNLARLTDLDSSGIGVLVRAFAHVNRSGGRCIFYAASSRVLMLLKMVRLDTVLELVDDEATALSRL